MKKLLLVGLVLVVAAGGFGGWVYLRLTRPYRGFSGDETFVDLPQGLGVAEIARRLAEAGVVPDALTFRLAARLSHADRRLEAGEYRFAEAATPGAVAARLARGDVYKIAVVVPEGLTMRETAAIVERSGIATAEAFLQAAADPALVATMDPEAVDLEGYLFPDTYTFSRHLGAQGAVRAMVQAFERALTPPLRAAAAEQGLSVRQLVTLASIVEKETGRSDERPVVAAVYRNRLRLGMPLQCDPTVIYALMQAGRWDGNIHKQDLQIDSPYNTYKHAGLPPGPIASPGLASIDAVLHPADVPYLYFVSRNDGTHAFSATLAEHNRNVRKYQIRR